MKNSLYEFRFASLVGNTRRLPPLLIKRFSSSANPDEKIKAMNAMTTIDPSNANKYQKIGK